MRTTTYVTNAIPYVNGDPHLGHALEFVQADAIARHRRARGQAVRYLSGTDDHAFKNVLRRRGRRGSPWPAFVDARADRFAALREPLELSHDAFIRTSVDPRHRAGVERLWRACAAAGDLYQRDYEGRYCTGCEAFLGADELVDGRCAGARRAAGARRRAQLVLPPLALPRAARGRDRDRRAARRARDAAQRGARRAAGRARRHQRVARQRAGPRLGHPGAGRSRRRPSTSGSTRWRTTSPRSATRDDDAAYRALVARGGRAHPRRRQGHHALPRRSTGRRSCSRPGCRCRRACWCTAT